jgi:hypothetical protein
MVSRRDLATTLRMLQAAGISAGAMIADGKVRVWLSQPNPDLAPWIYEGTDREYAAHWLAAYVVYFYPKSDLAKVWNLVRQATAALGQTK